METLNLFALDAPAFVTRHLLDDLTVDFVAKKLLCESTTSESK